MPNRRTLLIAASVASVALLTACSSTSGPATGAAAGTYAGTNQAITHVHGVARDATTGQVVIATHEGAFLRDSGEWVARGPVVDLMGFTIAADGTWLASGHPGINVDLPQPVGLISSTDQGRTWTVESRGGQSDFHALATGRGLVVGFDGALRTTSDRRTWADRAIPAPAHSLGVSPKSGTVLATTEKGLLRSTDGGQNWTTLAPPGLVALVAWADDQTIVGATVEGVIVTSVDGGKSWKAGTTAVPEVSALSASRLPSGQIEILIVSGTSVLVSTDGGSTTTRLS